MILSQVYNVAALQAMIADATILGIDLKVGLNTAIVVISDQLTVGDMVEPTFTGYARTGLTMGTVFRDDALGIASLSQAVTFQMSGTPVPCLVQGIFLMGGTASALFYGYEALPQPFQFNDVLDALTVTLEYVQKNALPGLFLSTT